MSARKSRSEWRSTVRAFERSGQTHEAFCEERDVNLGSFRGWLYKLRREPRPEDIQMVAVDVVASRVLEVASTGDLFVELGADLRVRVPVGVDARYVAALVAEASWPMLTLPSSVRVYLAAEPVDLRRGHDGLVAIVRAGWKLDPFDGHLFVFLGKRLDRVKILVWDRNGFVLYYKRLSKGRFRMPEIATGAARAEIDATTLAMLLDGIDVQRVARPPRWFPPRAAAGAG